MATKTGYIAINRGDFWWQFVNARTVISNNLQNGYASDTASWPVHTEENLLLKMEEDEYPSGVSLSGTIVNLAQDNGYGTNITLALCDQNGNYSHNLNTVWCDAHTWSDPSVGGSGLHANPVSLSAYSTPSGVDMGWTDLAGKILALARPESGSGWDKLCVIQNTATINVTIGYVQKTVTISAGSGGTISFVGSGGNAKMMARNAETQILITAYSGYKIKGTPQATSGTLTPTSVSTTRATYNFKMSQPATNVAISVEFEYDSFSITKNTNIAGVANITGPDSAVVGTSVTITRGQSGDEYRFDGWEIKTGNSSVNFMQSGNTAIFTMPPGAVTVTANYTAHAITWSGASISATQDGTDITLTYKGIATDNLGRQITYWIYRNGIKDERDTTDLVNPLSNPPNNNAQSVVVHVNSGDESKEIRFSLVAESGAISSGGASVSLNVGAVNRTVKYCKKSGKTHEWIECIQYYCVGPKYEQLSDNTLYTQYIRVSYPGTYTTDIIPINGKQYTFKNNTDEIAKITLADPNNGTSGVITINPGNSSIQPIVNTRRHATFEIVGEGSVEIICEDYPDVYNLLPAGSKSISGVWVEVEPYYFSGPDGWQLCSFA